MNRRDLFRLPAAMGLAAAIPNIGNARPQQALSNPLQPPAEGSIPVAVLLSDGAVVIDFAGPWEVFQNVSVPGRATEPVFQLYTVAETTALVKAGGSMTIVPNTPLPQRLRPRSLLSPPKANPLKPCWPGYAGGAHCGPDHVGLHRRLCTGQNEPVVRQSRNHTPQRLCAIRDGVP
jgi:hypothetical protein